MKQFDAPRVTYHLPSSHLPGNIQISIKAHAKRGKGGDYSTTSIQLCHSFSWHIDNTNLKLDEEPCHQLLLHSTTKARISIKTRGAKGLRWPHLTRHLCIIIVNQKHKNWVAFNPSHNKGTHTNIDYRLGAPISIDYFPIKWTILIILVWDNKIIHKNRKK